MKTVTFLTTVLVIVIAGCRPYKTTYIEILGPDKASYAGRLDFRLEPGDTLKVISSKTCRGGFGTCWEVFDKKRKKTGYVKAKRMKEKHKVYLGEE